VTGRKTDGVRMGGDIVHPQRLRSLDQPTQQSAHFRVRGPALLGQRC
jgi:hypothetical protein